MVKDIFYAVSRKGQGRIFTECPTRDDKLGVWVGESAGYISMTVILMQSYGFQLPKVTWEDSPVQLELSLNYGKD